MATKDTKHDDAQLEQHPLNDETQADDTTAAIDDAIAEDASVEPLDLQTELQQQKDRSLRLQAEMQNLRQRTAREVAEERRYGPLPLMRDILPVVDNIDRAIEAAEKVDDADSLLEGFRMVRQQLMTTLQQHHCEEIEAEGVKFDPELHEAMLQQPSPDHPSGDVLTVVRIGYRLHDRVVRPTQVIVSSGPPES